MLDAISTRLGAAVRPALLCCASAAAIFGSAHVYAQAYASREVSGWTVAASRDSRGCFLTRTYAGGGDTTVLLGQDIDGSNHLTVLNANWSIEPREQLKLSFRLSNGGYSNHPVVGMAADGKKGFVTSFEARFPTFFAASKALHIFRGDIPVEQLSLAGSGAAIAELRRCVDVQKMKTAGDGRKIDRANGIPADPFADDVKPGFRN